MGKEVKCRLCQEQGPVLLGPADQRHWLRLHWEVAHAAELKRFDAWQGRPIDDLVRLTVVDDEVAVRCKAYFAEFKPVRDNIFRGGSGDGDD